jgi:rhodanese-related sulfurtransferase
VSPALAAALLLAAAAAAPAPKSASIGEVEALLGKASATLVDVNTQAIWEEGHLPGAVHLEGRDVTKALPQDKARTAVFYCYSRHCTSSDEAARLAIEAGYTDVRVMREGITGWRRANKPVVREKPAAE